MASAAQLNIIRDMLCSQGRFALFNITVRLHLDEKRLVAVGAQLVRHDEMFVAGVASVETNIIPVYSNSTDDC